MERLNLSKYMYLVTFTIYKYVSRKILTMLRCLYDFIYETNIKFAVIVNGKFESVCRKLIFYRIFFKYFKTTSCHVFIVLIVNYWF